jgi:hypothetical protein
MWQEGYGGWHWQQRGVVQERVEGEERWEGMGR